MSKGSWIWDNPIADNWAFDLLTTRRFGHLDPPDVAPSTRDFLF